MALHFGDQVFGYSHTSRQASLADGQYTVRAVDQADNHASVSFTVDRTNPAAAFALTLHGTGPESFNSTITITGKSTYTALRYAAFYDGRDSSAPITTFSIQGSSFVFDGRLFVSTDAYIVLTATDPVVSGFNSQVATTFYRIDPDTSSASFSVYSSSIPVPLGLHTIEYKARDYAGNEETVKTSTFIATPGAAFRDNADFLVSGDVLIGFLDSGARFEVESRAEDSYTLKVSSPNSDPMLVVDNIGNVGVGLDGMQARLDVLGGGDSALQLRSGNSTGSLSSLQITFGYNGTTQMRHALRTQHHSSNLGNRMNFLVWNPGSGSTGTVANLDVLALQATGASAGSFHVRPSGDPDVELEVSNGSTTGGGTIHRAQAGTHSSRKIKSHIKYLGEKDEFKAFEEVMGLRHARFRYKGDAELREGLIYEEAPKSIQGPGKTIVFDERLANLELALKEAMRKVERLQQRLKELEAGTP